MKASYIVSTGLMMLLLINASGQCKYDFKKEDPFTGELTFRTNRFDLAGTVKEKGNYSAASFKVQFEKDLEYNMLSLQFKVIRTYGKGVLYVMGKDRLIIQYDDNSFDTLTMVRNPVVVSNGTSYSCVCKYEISDGVARKFRQGATVTAIRIEEMNFDIDLTDLRCDLSERYRACWLE